MNVNDSQNEGGQGEVRAVAGQLDPHEGTDDTPLGPPEGNGTPEDIAAWRKRWGWKVSYPGQDVRDQLRYVYVASNPIFGQGTP